MERRNDDYSDGHERYRQAPHGRPLESYEGEFPKIRLWGDFAVI